MERITNLDELKVYLRDNIDEESLLNVENPNEDSFANFQKGYDSGYANSYANLLYVLDDSFRAKFDEMVKTISGTDESENEK